MVSSRVSAFLEYLSTLIKSDPFKILAWQPTCEKSQAVSLQMLWRKSVSLLWNRVWLEQTAASRGGLPLCSLLGKSINLGKTKEIIFYNPRLTPNLIPPSIFGIEQVSSVKLLGVYIQEHLSCDMHFKHIILVSSQRLHYT